MATFFRVLYLVFVAVAEISLAFLLMPVLGVVVAVIAEILLFVVFMVIYAALFRGWRPSLNFLFGIGDFFS